jgi:uncharacterized peroxidase-related enzyme
MSRIAALDPAHTEGKTRETLAAVDKMLGGTPNLFRVTAQAPAALEGMVGLQVALARGKLRAGVREAIALAVSETNGCDYCLSAHTALGTGAGLSEEQMTAARNGTAGEAKTAEMLRFAQTLVAERGRVGAAGLATLRKAGVSDAEVLEVIANVAVTILTNYINLVADTDIDFPVVRTGSAR